MYRYQLHAHTSPTSRCGVMTAAELVEGLCQAGFAGCVLTNHFMHGNTGVDRSLPWENFVAHYERDYLECKALGARHGLDILFGLEEGVGGGKEILCYGLTPEMLYAHPELQEGSAALWRQVLGPLGVLIVQAHPFREASYISEPGPLPLETVDGIEVYNYGNDPCGTAPTFNQRAEELASAHPHLILTSGADAHLAKHAGRGGIATDKRITDEGILAAVLRGGDYTLWKQ